MIRPSSARRSRHRRTAVLATGLLLVISACGSSGEGSTDSDPTSESSPTGTSERGPRPDPDPASIDLTLDETAAATQTVGSDGGTIAATLPGGLTATLTIPAGALLSDVEVVMTPISAAQSDGGDAAVAGVMLEPDGLRFLRLVELEVTGPGIGSDWIGFSALADGGDFHAVPARAESGTLLVAVSHFSAAGIMEGQLAELLDEHTPASEQSYWESELADADLNGEGINYILETFADWAKGLGERLDQAGSEENLEQLTGELVSLLDRLERRVSDANDDGQELTNAIVLERVRLLATLTAWSNYADQVFNDHLDRCDSDGPIAAFRAYRWTGITKGLAERSPWVEVDQATFDSDSEKARACLTFDITWTGTVLHNNSTLSETWTGSWEAHAENLAVPPSVGLDGGSSGGLSEVVIMQDLVPTNYAEDRQTSSIFPCTPTLSAGEVTAALTFEVAVANLGDLGTTEVKNYYALLRETKAPVIECRDGGRNLWSTISGWIQNDNQANERLSEQFYVYQVPVDPSAVPAGSRGKLDANWTANTTIMGDATTAVTQSIVVTHAP